MRFIFALLALVFTFSLVGCGAGASGMAHTAAPLTLGSVESSPAPDARSAELASACDTYRARFRHTPVRLSDGTPVWCY